LLATKLKPNEKLFPIHPPSIPHVVQMAVGSILPTVYSLNCLVSMAACIYFSSFIDGLEFELFVSLFYCVMKLTDI
jgi:hypothetical protein